MFCRMAASGNYNEDRRALEIMRGCVERKTDIVRRAYDDGSTGTAAPLAISSQLTYRYLSHLCHLSAFLAVLHLLLAVRPDTAHDIRDHAQVLAAVQPRRSNA